MTTPIVDISIFTSPVNAPDDGDPLNVASIVPTAIQALANRTRNLDDRCGKFDGSGEFIYNGGAKSRVRIFSPFAMTEGILQVLGASTTSQYWTVAQFVSGGTAYSRTSQINFARLVMDLSMHLPPGGTLTRVEAIVAPGAVRAGANRMTMFLSRQTPDFGTPAIPVALGPLHQDFDDGATTNVQLLDTGVISEAINRTSDLTLQIIAGDTAGSSKDDVHAIRVSYDDPGPQNL